MINYGSFMQTKHLWYHESLSLLVVFLFTFLSRCFFCESYLFVSVFVILPCLFSAPHVVICWQKIDYLVHLYVVFSCSVIFPLRSWSPFNILYTKSRGYWDIQNLEIEILICRMNNFVFGYSNMSASFPA